MVWKKCTLSLPGYISFREPPNSPSSSRSSYHRGTICLMLLCRSYDKIVHNLEWPHVGRIGDIRCWEFNMWLSCLQFHGWNLSYVRLLRYFMTRRNCNFLQWRGHDKKWKIKWPQKRLEKVERWHVCSSHVAADAISVYNSANSRRFELS